VIQDPHVAESAHAVGVDRQDLRPEAECERFCERRDSSTDDRSHQRAYSITRPARYTLPTREHALGQETSR
jgi:hypothetical protein